MKIRLLFMTVLSLLLIVGCSSTEEFEDVQTAEVETEETLNYTILSEDVPQFDTTPIRYFDKGYIYLENGTYGFVTAENENIIPSGKYYSMCYMPTFEPGACMFPEGESFGDQAICVNQVLGLIDTNPCVVGVGGTTIMMSLGPDDHVYRHREGMVESSDYALILPRAQEVNSFDVDNSTYYIVSQDLSTIYGPYDASETASFTTISRPYIATGNPYFGTLSLYNGMRYYNLGLFYEKADSGYIIHSADGMNASTSVYDFAKPVSEEGMMVEKDGQRGIVDSSLNEVYMGDFEDCTELIGNRGYVKVDGKWLYVEFNN